MNPVAQAINAELELWRGKREDAAKSVETIDVHIDHLENVLRTYQEHPALVEREIEQETEPVILVPVDNESDRDELPVAPETPTDESPPQQETEAAAEEPAVDSSEAKPSQSKRDIVVSHIASLEIGREFTLQDIVEETEIHYGIVRDAAKVAVNLDLIDDQGGRPKIFERIPEGYGTSTETAPEPASEEPTEIELPEPLYEPEPEGDHEYGSEDVGSGAPEAPAPALPAPPAEPIGEHKPAADFVEQIFKVIKDHQPVAPHEIPTITGIHDGDAIRRATSALAADHKIEEVDGSWQVAGAKPKQADAETTEETRHSPEQQKLRDDILHFVGHKPRTGGQLAELLSIPIKELHPTLEQLRDDGEIKQERLLKRWELA